MLDRELNPGPLAPEARIIPLDHQARLLVGKLPNYFINLPMVKHSCTKLIVKTVIECQDCPTLNHRKVNNNNKTKISLLSGVGFEPTQSFDYESLNLTP